MTRDEIEDLFDLWMKKTREADKEADIRGFMTEAQIDGKIDARVKSEVKIAVDALTKKLMMTAFAVIASVFVTGWKVSVDVRDAVQDSRMAVARLDGRTGFMQYSCMIDQHHDAAFKKLDPEYISMPCKDIPQ